MVVGFKSRATQFRQSRFFVLKMAKHRLSLIISVRSPRVNNWYSGNVSGLERNGRWVQISCYSISSESFFVLKKPNMG